MIANCVINSVVLHALDRNFTRLAINKHKTAIQSKA